LIHGVDYKGNVCGNKHGSPNLHEFGLQYWPNPNQIYESGVKNSQFKLTNARSICLKECPIPSDSSLNWVCDYPEGEIQIKMDEWKDRNYNYFDSLTPEMRNSSLQLQVVEMSIDTIILSFCQDSEEHQGTAQYAPPLLIETLTDQNEMQRLTQGSSI
ncbi:Choline transporter protein, partial [Thalictrum thalictroides]